MRMADVAMATSAAPTIYRALPMGGYMLIDGGVWTNNPLMLAITEAMICYDVPRERIKVLSIGCGDDPCYVTRRMVGGGLWGSGGRWSAEPCALNRWPPSPKRGY